MGWSLGSELLGHIISAREEYLPETTKQKDISFYLELIEKFEDFYADTLDDFYADTLDDLKGMSESFDKALMITQAEYLLHSNECKDVSLDEFKSKLGLTITDVQFLKEQGVLRYDDSTVRIND